MTEREEILATLREEFRVNTRQRLDEMARLADEVAGGNASSCIDLRRHFHGLAGLGGTYGYNTVSEIGRAGEKLCQALEDKDEGVTLDTVRDLVVRLREAIERDPPG